MTLEDIGNGFDYSLKRPSPENAFGLFAGSWSSQFTSAKGVALGGEVPLATDDRIHWLIDQVGGVESKDILELGPLEGAHTLMLERAGARVTAIEAKHDAFLRCLIVKNYFSMSSQFLLGDFSTGFPEFGTGRWDLVVASGVLYHMSDPVGLVKRLSEVTDSLYLWTHYFNPRVEEWNEQLRPEIGRKWLVDQSEKTLIGQTEVELIPQTYGQALEWSGFCGGPASSSKWILRDDLLALLEAVGFQYLHIAHDEPQHPNGPAMSILARKKP